MEKLITELKQHARRLHSAIKSGNAAALAQVHKTAPDLKNSPEAEAVKRRHCLKAVACQLGFRGWPHAVQVLTEAQPGDFGTLLYPGHCAAHWNIWFADYEEARQVRAEHGGFLLGYRHQYFVADQHFIETLGLDPNDADWEAIGRDWISPKDPEARTRLYGQLIRQRLQPSS
jgi:hypothetical protein